MDVRPLEPFIDETVGTEMPLPKELARLYGPLRFPGHPGRPYVLSNFVASLDGVVSLGMAAHQGGKPISGDDPHDEMVVGLLRAVSDAMVIGAVSLRESPGHRWQPEDICPGLAALYQRIRLALKAPSTLPIFVVTGRGDLDPAARVLQKGEPTVVLTTAEGADRLARRGTSRAITIRVLGARPPIPPHTIVDTVASDYPEGRILLEAGPHLTGSLLNARLVDELFLTIAPQVVGRDILLERPGIVAGVRFAPEHGLWAHLVGLKRGGDHLFLRYRFHGKATPVPKAGNGAR